MNRRSRRDSDSGEVPDFLFGYSDSDSLSAELAEWYAYSEEPEFVWNANAFKNNLFKKYHGETKWRDISRAEKRAHVMRLLEQADISDRPKRETFYRSILYIAQGIFKECDSIDEYSQNLVENVELLFDCDAFNVFVELLIYETNEMCNSFNAENKYAPCITDNADLRVILSVLYTMLEVVRCYDKEVAENRLPSSLSMSQLSNSPNNILPKKYLQLKEQLKSDLNQPLEKTNELFSIFLFQLICKFCNHNIIVLPIKKIILLLWKTLLFTLGGFDDVFRLKNELRAKFGLPLIAEDPSVVLSKMTPATPPPNPVDLVGEIQFANPNSSYKRKKNGLTKQTRGIDNDDMLISNSINNSNGKLTQFGFSQGNNNNNDNNDNNASLSESSSVDSENNQATSESDRKNNEDAADSIGSDIFEDTSSSVSDLATVSEIVDVKPKVEDGDQVSSIDDSENESKELSTIIKLESSSEVSSDQRPSSPTSSTASEESTVTEGTVESSSSSAASESEKLTSEAIMLKMKMYKKLKCLPWSPKVRLCELEMFLDQERKKFLGYGDLYQDLDTLVGLPTPIHESIKTLKQHLYISLADEQIKIEEKFLKYPMSTKEVGFVDSSSENDENTDSKEPAEILYSNLLNNLPQYLICLLKILLTSVPQTRAKNDSLQIMSDLFPEELSGSHFLNVKLGIDSNRHKEILIKSISAIILLMLKHFKVNHVYQFEFMSQHLLFANCIPLILKFFNLNISSFVQSKNNHCQLDFPNCVIGEQAEVDADELENGDSSIFRWRNVFSCINLLRILNKLTKYKRSRVMMLVIFKSAPILKKVLRIKQPMLQYYALKLLKMQTRHLGRQWRKTNMSVMSAIYQKVRHRLNDDWAFGNEQETQGWDFQSDECALRARIDKFNQRRYRASEEPLNTEFLPLENSLLVALTKELAPTDLPDDFQNNYETWLDEEVYSSKIDWDIFLARNNNSNCYILF